jgi:Ser/Thr protein kinase RdoA (MazF antagonist)
VDWEIALLDHLADHGLRVPVALPAFDGRRQVGGVVVQT